MNAVFASGVNAFSAATARLDQAAGQINRARPSTIPALSQSATAPNAPAGQPVAPPPPAGPGGRVPSFGDTYVEATVDLVKAKTQAALAATSIRVADDMVGELLDLTA